MQTQRTAAPQEESSGARRSNPLPAIAAGDGDEQPKRRQVGITGPGLRRVPSLIALKGAERHSRIVRMMRVILPALALLVIGVVMLQAFMYRADDTLKLSFAQGGTIADDLKMVRPELSTRFGDDNRIKFAAQEAYRDKAAPQRVIMNRLQGDLALGSGSWFSLSAFKGVLDTETARIVLGGGIEVFSDLGYELHTNSAVFDTKKGTVTGQTEVYVQGPAGTGRSDGFSIVDDGNRIRLEGNVRMTFVPPGSPSG